MIVYRTYKACRALLASPRWQRVYNAAADRSGRQSLLQCRQPALDPLASMCECLDQAQHDVRVVLHRTVFRHPPTVKQLSLIAKPEKLGVV
jgi:hypothetical protein